MTRFIFDDRSFAENRGTLFASRLEDEADRARQSRMVRALQRGLSHQPHAETLRALSHLSRRHGESSRAHLQTLEVALESTALVPAADLVHACVQTEWLWFTTPWKGFYRDHLAHVLKVTESALRLLLTGDAQGKPLVDVIAEGLADRTLGASWLRAAARRLGVTQTELESPTFWRPVVLEATRCACLLHDLAYPHKMAQKVDKATGITAAWSQPTAGAPLGAALLESLDQRLVAVPFGGGSGRTLDAPAHQWIAALAVESHSLQAGLRILQWTDAADRVGRLHPTEAFVMEWAALAASVHDYDKCWKEPATWFGPNFDNRRIRPCWLADPVTFLVALCDQLQDYGRVSYTQDPDAHPDQATLHAVRPVRQVELQLDADGSTITYGYALDDERKASRSAVEACKKAHQKCFPEIFGPNGWFDAKGLTKEFRLE